MRKPILFGYYFGFIFFVSAVLIACKNKGSNEGSTHRIIVPVKDTIINHVALVRVSQGPFKSGLHCSTKNIPYNYWIGKYEITNQQYFKFLQDAIRLKRVVVKDQNIYVVHPKSTRSENNLFIVKYIDQAIYLDANGVLTLNSSYAKHPVISVTWFGAKAYCDFYGFQLPSANEWEKAARGNHCFRYPWGNTIDAHYANYFNSQDPYEPGTTPVGFYNGKTNAGFKTRNAVSPYGCYDMAGNAWEWTRDKFAAAAPHHLGKGGGFNIHTAAGLQIYYISTFRVAQENPSLDCTHLADGFRVVQRSQN